MPIPLLLPNLHSTTRPPMAYDRNVLRLPEWGMHKRHRSMHPTVAMAIILGLTTAMPGVTVPIPRLIIPEVSISTRGFVP